MDSPAAFTDGDGPDLKIGFVEMRLVFYPSFIQEVLIICYSLVFFFLQSTDLRDFESFDMFARVSCVIGLVFLLEYRTLPFYKYR